MVSSNLKTRINIENLDISGDMELNNFVKEKIERLNDEDSDKTISITAKTNYSKETQIKNIAKKLKNKKILINSIINNAAIDAVPKKDLKNEFISSYQWKKELDVSLLGSYLIIKFFIDFLKKNKNLKIFKIC